MGTSEITPDDLRAADPTTLETEAGSGGPPSEDEALSGRIELPAIELAATRGKETPPPSTLLGDPDRDEAPEADGTFESRLDRLVDVVAGALVVVFAFGIPLPERGLSLRTLVFPLVSWLVFALQVGLLWNLHREARVGRRRNAAAVLLHLPFLGALLLLTIPARRILLLHELWTGPVRRGEFLDALAWYAVLLGVGVCAVGGMIAAEGSVATKSDGDGPGPGKPATGGIRPPGSPALEALIRSKLRLYFGSGALAFLTAWLLPRLGGLAILPWGLFPSWVLVERSRLLARFPELAKRLG